jgi:hypothetical protein
MHSTLLGGIGEKSVCIIFEELDYYWGHTMHNLLHDRQLFMSAVYQILPYLQQSPFFNKSLTIPGN